MANARASAFVAAGALLALVTCAAGGCRDRDDPAPPTVLPSPDGTPRRIVAFTCGAVDTIIALGAIDRVVAVEEDCPVPGTEHAVKIRNDDHPGQVHVVQVESILALRPDLVIAKSDLKEAFEGRGLRMLWSPPVVSLQTLPGFVEEIATALGMPEDGRRLVERMRAKEAEIRGRVAPLPKVRVYYENNGAGRSAGTGTIVDAMIRLAGGASIVGDDPRPGVHLSPEAVVAADPEVIVLGPFSESVEAVRARPGWDRISAVRNGRVHKIPETRRYVMLGSPRCVDGCEELFVPWFHPEAPGRGR